MMKKFFLMTRGRTGSTAIIDELDKCKDFKVHQELFLRFEFKELKDKKLLDKSDYFPPFLVWKKYYGPKFRSSKYLANLYLGRAEKLASDNNSEVFGFKLLSHHFDENKYLSNLLKNRNYVAIYLTRNMSKQTISGLIAKERNMWNTETAFTDETRYSIDLAEFQKLVRSGLDRIEIDKTRLVQTGISFIEVSYEKFISNRKDFFENIFEFMNIYPEVPAQSGYKVMIKDPRYTIKNYDEVAIAAERLGVPLEE